MKDKNITMLILSCDKFSDLWDGHIKLLEKNWEDRNMPTFIVTEGKEAKKYENVSFITTGYNLEWTEKLACALNNVNTEYVFLTLDDYYLIKKVENTKISKILNMMDDYQLDYVRLYKNPKKATKKELAKKSNLKWIDTNVKYSVNLYTGIWRKDFLLAMIKEKSNVWRFEVSLFQKANKYGAKCCVSCDNVFTILDVVRKGKLLHRAVRYFKKNPNLYNDSRPIQSWSYEIKLGIRTVIAGLIPLKIYPFAKKIAHKMGYTFFSDEVEK